MESMMNAIEFTVGLACIILPSLAWACNRLVGEQWQMLAVIPSKKKSGCVDGSWQGRNVTFYGFLLANGCLAGLAVFFLLCSSIGLTLMPILLLSTVTLFISLMAASLLARLVEKKKNTLTVAGGATVGIYLLPLTIIILENSTYLPHTKLEIIPLMGAVSIAYLFGEGLGRVACISFGCCYGKPVNELGARTRRFFSKIGCVFHGHTKKIAYASQLDGIKVVPIQAITAFTYVIVALIATYLFLEGHFHAAFGLSSLVAMGWRFISERLRADYRGGGRITAYQYMAAFNICFCIAMLILLRSSVTPLPDLNGGLTFFWNPAVLLFLQISWASVFLYTGVSKVTSSSLTFQVLQRNI